ncbi:HSF-type DNA-binding protein [Phlyctema vagabunda]|uniref:HSF-type DNA-binding protein n=1 Tax=Phlyctema vagabunda TaxID=108571 RepID=A0ABR4PXD4_9HELO
MEENDNIELLEERAAVAKRDAQSKRKQIPPFVQKLSSFLDESKNTELIRWSERGDSFVVLDEDEFAKTLIPELFKHNNYASFVRQLNMYGFHKRVGLSDNSMKASERKNKSPSEYYNPYFKRNHPNLLWLIQKPKGGKASAKSATSRRVKNEEADGESADEEVKDVVEEIYGHNYGPNNMPSQNRAISAAPESGPLQRREMAVVQSQLADIQKQQGIITNAIGRLRKEHNALYQQSMAFQTLHDRHESSINAILTFLATVYNRSLDGQGPQNVQQMAQAFAEQAQQQAQHGSVVDMGDLSNQRPPTPGSPSPHRRQQRLLMAPPSGVGRASTLSPGAPSTQNTQHGAHKDQATPKSGAIEELFDTPPTEGPKVKVDPEQLPRQEMMDLINNTNAQTAQPGNKLDFPEMLSQYENSNGNSPLTTEQRNSVLNIIANTASAPGSNNALVSPSPPQAPTLAELGYAQSDLDDLSRLHQAQGNRIDNVESILQPLSPSAVLSGLGDASHYFTSEGASDSHASNLDLDQFLDSGAYYNNSPAPDYNFDSYNDVNMDSNFNFGLDGVTDSTGRIVETGGSSAATSPENVEDHATNGQNSPSKKRRKA